MEVLMQGDGVHPGRPFRISLRRVSHYGIWSVSIRILKICKKYADFLALMKKSLEWEMLNNSNNNDSTILIANLRFQHWSSVMMRAESPGGRLLRGAELSCPTCPRGDARDDPQR